MNSDGLKHVYQQEIISQEHLHTFSLFRQQKNQVATILSFTFIFFNSSSPMAFMGASWLSWGLHGLDGFHGREGNYLLIF